MAQLVAVDLPAGEAFVRAVRECWDRGDAVAPLDPRDPPPRRRAILEAIRPTVLLDVTGARPVAGEEVDDGDSLVMCTSGTSGPPKAAVLTMDALEASAYASATVLGVEPDICWLGCLPLHHIGGFGVLARSLITDTPVVLHDRFDPHQVEAAARAGCTHTSMVPTMLARVDPSWFRRILLGGAAPPPHRPPHVVATYGMTETCGGVVYDGLALPGVEMTVAPDGEILVRSPTLLRCYRDGTPVPVSHGWFRTGDLGTIDPDSGRLEVQGRREEVIVTGGEKVWPTDLEAVLLTHPLVAEVAVFGRPDPDWGQRVVAAVVPVRGGDPPRLEELRALVAEHLPRAYAPRELKLVDHLPRTALGKIQRGRLGS
jgi:O-succinylbenzoic acid--CoA ligase